MLNSKQVGEVKNYDDNTGIIYWDIPYQEGKLEVIGIDKDEKTICNYALQSSGRPYALMAQSDLSLISKNRGVAQPSRGVGVADYSACPPLGREPLAQPV